MNDPQALLQSIVDFLASLVGNPPLLFASIPAAWLPAAIFAMRSLDQGIATMRMLVTNQGRALLAWFLALIQSFVFLAAISSILSQLNNPWNILAFAAGSGMGSVIGLALDHWSAAGHAMLHIVSPTRGAALVDRLRLQGYGATEFAGQGRDGTVNVILSAVPRRQLGNARRAVVETDPQAFVTIEPVQVLSGGK